MFLIFNFFNLYFILFILFIFFIYLWESSGSLDSNELDVGGFEAPQRNELIVLGQNIAFSSKRRLVHHECLQLINEAIYLGPWSARGFL